MTARTVNYAVYNGILDTRWLFYLPLFNVARRDLIHKMQRPFTSR